MSNITAYPLSWPETWPRTEAARRERGSFKTQLSTALNNLRREVQLLGGKALVLSSNYTLGSESPANPGVVAYFTWQEMPVAIPCDRWSRIEHNVQAIALTIAAMRGMERWGAKHMIKAMFTGFKALPAPSSVVKRPWWDVLGVKGHASTDEVKEAWRRLAATMHPDKGGSHEGWLELDAAWNEFKRERGES